MTHFSVYRRGKKIPGEVFLKRFRTEEVGIFESLRTYYGKIFQEKEHLDRLFESARTAGFSGIPSYRALSKELDLAVGAYQREREGRRGNKKATAGPENQRDVFIRLTLVPGGNIFVLMGEKRHSETIYREGVSLRTSPVKRSLSNAAAPETKTSSYHNALLASLEPNPRNDYECVFLNQEGFVTEVRIGNLFVVKEESCVGAPSRRAVTNLQRAAGFSPSSKKIPLLATPPTLGILNGITRRLVIKWALQTGIPVKEMPLMRHDVYNAEEVFLTNTSWEILPVAQLDCRRIGVRVPGPITLELQNLMRKKIEEECL